MSPVSKLPSRAYLSVATTLPISSAPLKTAKTANYLGNPPHNMAAAVNYPPKTNQSDKVLFCDFCDSSEGPRRFRDRQKSDLS